MPIHVSALSPTFLRYDMTAFFVLAVSCMLVKDLRSTTGLLMEVNLKTSDVF